jgi:hypothetical protein
METDLIQKIIIVVVLVLPFGILIKALISTKNKNGK